MNAPRTAVTPIRVDIAGYRADPYGDLATGDLSTFPDGTVIKAEGWRDGADWSHLWRVVDTPDGKRGVRCDIYGHTF